MRSRPENHEPIRHIQQTVKDFKYIYYQRHLIKGFFDLPIPTIMAIKSPIGDGYVYLRKRINAIQTRDFDNEFIWHPSDGRPLGVKNNPVRGVDDSVSVQVRLAGRAGYQTWVFTKGDLPRIVNEETFTEFLACIPIDNINNPIVGKYDLIKDYYERFIDIYRIVSGDATVVHFSNGLSFVPFTGEAIVEIADHVTETFDEIIVNYYPENFTHNMFQFNPHYAETAGTNAYHDEMERAQRVGHFLASGLEVNQFHRRIADLIAVAQQTRDHTLLVQASFPVFETFYNSYISEVSRIEPEFRSFFENKKRKAKGNFIQIAEKLKWLPTAIRILGFDASSVGLYFAEIDAANKLRRAVVHDGRRVGADEAGHFVQSLSMCVVLCETSLGKAIVYAAPLKRL